MARWKDTDEENLQLTAVNCKYTVQFPRQRNFSSYCSGGLQFYWNRKIATQILLLPSETGLFRNGMESSCYQRINVFMN